MTLTEHLTAEGIVHLVDGRAHLFTGPILDIEVSQYRSTHGASADLTDIARTGPRPFAYVEPSGRVWIMSYSSGVILLAGRKATDAQQVAAEVLTAWLTAEYGIGQQEEPKPKKGKKAQPESEPEVVEASDE